MLQNIHTQTLKKPPSGLHKLRNFPTENSKIQQARRRKTQMKDKNSLLPRPQKIEPQL
jgi:hypothetical protein